MNYIVLDMEWNQRIKGKKRVRVPVMLNGEIIQFGAVKLDENYSVIDTFKIMVSPKYYKQMHEKVSQITKITAEDLQYGFPFEVAFEHFKKWCGNEFTFLTWGFDDVNMLRDNMLLHKMDTTWIPTTYNLQVVFDNQISKEQRQVSLMRAMEMLGEPALESHDALNDAINTAHICLHLDMEKGLSEYDAAIRQMHCCVQTNVKQQKPDKVYSSKREALKDKDLINFYHPDFDEFVTCVDFVEQNDAKFMAIGKSESGKELFVRFKFKRWGEKEYSVSRIVYEMNEKNKNYYISKKKRIMQAKAEYIRNLKRVV